MQKQKPQTPFVQLQPRPITPLGWVLMGMIQVLAFLGSVKLSMHQGESQAQAVRLALRILLLVVPTQLILILWGRRWLVKVSQSSQR
jgi:hypothetical protein